MILRRFDPSENLEDEGNLSVAQEKRYRLADSTVVEPLINNWAVWSDLISPVPYSLHLLNYQIKTLTSYLANPQIHLTACQNPKLTGGPFVNVPAERASEIQELLSGTEKQQSENIKLAQVITDFYNYLSKEAAGQSLEPYYEQLPDALRGYVELLYDYYNHPIVRFFESLLYESRYYDKNLQSLRIFEQTRDNSRPFFLSTPRLLKCDQISWTVPFENCEISELFQLDDSPQQLGGIRELLGLSPVDESRLLPLLSSDSVVPTAKWDGPGTRIRYFGHACVLVEWNGTSILTDPWVGTKSKEGGVERLSYQDLPAKIDFALITHGHHDHFVPETLLRLRPRIECLVVPKAFGLFYADTSLKLAAKKLGFKHVIEMDPLDSIELPNGEIIAVPFLGEHADLPHTKTGYVVRAGQEQILFAADSNCLDKTLYENIRQTIGAIETVFLGMECVGAPLSWLYGALLPLKLQREHNQSRRTRGCDANAALSLLEAVGAQRVYIYAMGNEPWLQYSMGLGLSEDSVQIKESDKLLAKARARDFIDARRPFAKFETCLGRA